MADVLEKRIRAAIEDNTDEVLTELTDLRDRADQLMHAIRESSRASIDGAVTHARRVSKAIQAKKFIARALEQIEAEFNGKGNAVITQQKKQ
jgi:predicted translin family RNA/ssDNA-binding protein